MGDGLLAIFTADDRGHACDAALRAGLAARRGVAAVNQRRAAKALPITDMYLALHIDDVFYGNIGSKERLDFTVVGPIEKLQGHSGLRIGATSVGHTTYTYGRTFAWLLGLKEPRFVLGYSSIEVDTAMARGELDARSNNTAEVIRRNPDAVKKNLFDFAAILKIPREDKEPDFDRFPEIDSFAKSERERQFLKLTRSTRLVGTPYLLSPGTPKELVQILREAMKKTFQDPEFHREFKKLSGDDASALMPEVQKEIIRTIPRDAETIELFKVINGNQPLPPR